jgi:hypothetical protein
MSIGSLVFLGHCPPSFNCKDRLAIPPRAAKFSLPDHYPLLTAINTQILSTLIDVTLFHNWWTGIDV